MNDNINDLLSKIMAMVEEKVVEKKKRKTRTYTEEEREVLRERVKKARDAKKTKRDGKVVVPPNNATIDEVKEDICASKPMPTPTMDTKVVTQTCIFDGFGESEFCKHIWHAKQLFISQYFNSSVIISVDSCSHIVLVSDLY